MRMSEACGVIDYGLNSVGHHAIADDA